MHAVAKEQHTPARTSSSAGKRGSETKSRNSSSSKNELNSVKKHTEPSSNFTVKELRKDSATNGKTDPAASAVSTNKSAPTVESFSNKVAAKAEQTKQKIVEAMSVPEASTTASSNKKPAEKTQQEKDRRQSASSTASDELAKKDLPKEIAVGPTNRRKSEISTKTELTDEDGSKADSSSAQQQTAEHYVREQYGLSELPTEDKSKPVEEVELRYASALCFAIGRAYTEDQQEWILGDLSAKGYSQSVLDKIPELLKHSAGLMDLEVAVESKQLITGDLKKDAHMLVYDMYRCSIICGFPDEQEVAIAMIAEEIGVNKFGQLEEIKKQVELEEEVKKNRLKLLHPEGRNNIEERYEDVVEEEKSSKGGDASTNNNSKSRRS